MDWLYSVRAVLMDRQLSPAPTEHDSPRWWGALGESGDVARLHQVKKDIAQCSWVWGCRKAPSWGCTNRETESHPTPNNKVLLSLSWALFPPAAFTARPSSWATHPTTWSPQNHIISLSSLPTFYQLTAHSAHSLLQVSRIWFCSLQTSFWISLDLLLTMQYVHIYTNIHTWNLQRI